jgi:cysteine desulfurase
MLRAVLDEYNAAATQAWGNPSGQYHEGAMARGVLQKSREVFAGLMAVPPETIYFTSCGTESNNIVLRSVMTDCAARSGRNIIVTSAVEHSSIAKTAGMCGFEHIKVPVDRRGYIREPVFREILSSNRSKVGLVSIIMAQNEVGTIQNITKLIKIAREILPSSVPFHVDATQMLGKYYIEPRRFGIDLLTGSAHKFHGPRGVGILYVARQDLLRPETTIMSGGGQERGCRCGTENVPAIAAAAVAFNHALGSPARWERRVASITALRDTIMVALRRQIPGLAINGDPENGLYNTLSVAFPGGHGHAMLEVLDHAGITVGSGSACSKGRVSDTLLAIYGSGTEGQAIAHGTIRISLSELTTAEDAQVAVEAMVRAYRETMAVIAAGH